MGNKLTCNEGSGLICADGSELVTADSTLIVCSSSGKLWTGGSGVSSDIDGVATGRANSGDPVSRYCGPAGKLVSWAALIPISRKDKQNRLRRRIPTSGTSRLQT